MNELVALIVKKTKISEVMAVMIVNIVIDYISKKLPAPFGTQVKAFLENEALMEGAGDLLEGLAAAAAKKKTTKKKNWFFCTQKCTGRRNNLPVFKFMKLPIEIVLPNLYH